MSESKQLEIEECDQAGNVVATYIASSDPRVDIVVRGFLTCASARSGGANDAQRPQQTKSYAQQLLDVFLPAGYPHSVTKDYTQYVISS